MEHLLLALLDNPAQPKCCAPVLPMWKTCARRWRIYHDNTPQVAGTDEVDTQPTLGIPARIQRAIMHGAVHWQRQEEVDNVLVAIFGERIRMPCTTFTSRASRAWTWSTTLPTASRRASRQSPPRAQKALPMVKKAPAAERARKPLRWSSSRKTSTSWPRKAKIDPLIGRHYEVERTIQIPVPPPQEQPAAGG